MCEDLYLGDKIIFENFPFDQHPVVCQIVDLQVDLRLDISFTKLKIRVLTPN